MFLLPSGSVHNFNLMEESNHVSGRIPPFTKTSREGAHSEAFREERHGETIVMHTRCSVSS